jgi:hypothetical protein
VPAGPSEELHIGTTDKPQIAAAEVPAALAEKPHTAPTEVPTDPASKPHTAMGEVPTDVPARNAAQNAAPAVLRSRSTCSEHAAIIDGGTGQRP